ncbi:hypothetical protein EJB05_18891, partial [Eragrostis curvula]
MPLGGIGTVVVTTSPMMVFVSHKADGCIMWADQNSEYFQEFRARYPDEPMCMTSFAGNVYFTNRQGSILSFVVDGAPKERSAQTISLTTIIPSPNPTQHSNYLVESGAPPCEQDMQRRGARVEPGSRVCVEQGRRATRRAGSSRGARRAALSWAARRAVCVRATGEQGRRAQGRAAPVAKHNPSAAISSSLVERMGRGMERGRKE